MSETIIIKVELGETSLAAFAGLEKALTGAGTAAKTAAKAAKTDAKTGEPKGEKSDGPGRDDVRKALKDHAAIEGKESAIAILKEAGAASIGELDEDKFADVITAAA